MNGLDKLVEHIRIEAEVYCTELAKKAADDCEQIKADYAKAEQDTYWSSIDAGTKETERRMERLNTLAEMEANKQILATQQEMISEAFDLAAKKLQKLPKRDYAELLKRLDLKDGASAYDVVAGYKNELAPRVASVLFK